MDPLHTLTDKVLVLEQTATRHGALLDRISHRLALLEMGGNGRWIDRALLLAILVAMVWRH